MDEDKSRNHSVPPKSSTTPRELNSVEARLFGGDKLEIDALIAFSLYFREKREWEKAYVNAKGSLPSATDVEIFDLAWSPSKVQSLREDANRILKVYSHEISARAIRNFQMQIDRSERTSFVRTTTFSLIIVVVFGVASYFSQDFGVLAKHLFFDSKKTESAKSP